MKRLSLEELKAQKSNVIYNLDAIKGGDTEKCHPLHGPGPAGPVGSGAGHSAVKF